MTPTPSPPPGVGPPTELMLVVDDETALLSGLLAITSLFEGPHAAAAPHAGARVHGASEVAGALAPLPPPPRMPLRPQQPQPLTRARLPRLTSRLTLLKLQEASELPSSTLPGSADGDVSGGAGAHARGVSLPRGIAEVTLQLQRHDAWAAASAEVAQRPRRVDFLLVPEALLRKHVKPDRPLAVGLMIAAAGGMGDAVRSLLGGGSRGGGGGGSGGGSGGGGGAARAAGCAPLVRALLIGPLPCGVVTLFDYGSLGAASAKIMEMEEDDDGAPRNVLCVVEDGPRAPASAAALDFLRCTSPERAEVTLLRLRAPEAAAEQASAVAHPQPHSRTTSMGGTGTAAAAAAAAAAAVAPQEELAVDDDEYGDDGHGAAALLGRATREVRAGRGISAAQAVASALGGGRGAAPSLVVLGLSFARNADDEAAAAAAVLAACAACHVSCLLVARRATQ